MCLRDYHYDRHTTGNAGASTGENSAQHTGLKARIYIRGTWLVALMLVTLTLFTTTRSALAGVGEGVNTTPTAWWWAVEQTPAQIAALLKQNNARLTSIQVANGTSPPLLTVSMVQNTGTYAKQWWWFTDVTVEQVLNYSQILTARVVSMDAYVVDGTTKVAAVLISNKGVDVTQWWISVDLSGPALGSTLSEKGARHVDWRQYSKNGVTLNAAVMVPNSGPGQTAWWFYPGLSPSQIESYLSSNNAMLISVEPANASTSTFNVIMNQNPDPGIGPINWWYGVDDAKIHSLVNSGTMRMVDIKNYYVNGARVYVTITVNNAPYSGNAASEATCDASVLAQWQGAIPAVGLASPSSAQAYDQAVTQFMQQYNLPGGAVGVVQNGKLVLARGYGFADKDGARIAHPDNLFRLASLSKGIMAAAILVAYQNRQNGLLALDQTFPFEIIGLTPNPPATQQHPVPSQLNSISIRHLLNHTGGFSRECNCTISVPANAPSSDQPLNGNVCANTCDPMGLGKLLTIEQLPGNSIPPTCNQAIQYMMTQPLTWKPGQVEDYSNFGYCVLQATIEKVTATDYPSWVAANVLIPAGANAGILPGHTIDIADHEVTYYDLPGNYPLQSIFDTTGLCQNAGTPNASAFCAPAPYGGVVMEAALGDGGWLATAVDLLRLEVALDGRNGLAPLLTPASITELEKFPNVWTVTENNFVVSLSAPDATFYYGFGFNIDPTLDWQNVGGFNGTLTHEYRGGSNNSTAGFGWVALFNGTPNDPQNTSGYQIGQMMQNAFAAAGGANGNWLSTNLFDQYGAYTNWMTFDAYQTYFDTQNAKGMYPSRVEGKNVIGTPMYRGFFAPFKAANFFSSHAMDCLTYSQQVQTMAADGFQIVSLGAYVGGDGLRKYQATWIKW